MDVRINNLTSDVHVTDARALLSPEVLREIVKAVARELRQEERERKAREADTKIDKRAASLE